MKEEVVKAFINGTLDAMAEGKAAKREIAGKDVTLPMLFATGQYGTCATDGIDGLKLTKPVNMDEVCHRNKRLMEVYIAVVSGMAECDFAMLASEAWRKTVTKAQMEEMQANNESVSQQPGREDVVFVSVKTSTGRHYSGTRIVTDGFVTGATEWLGFGEGEHGLSGTDRFLDRVVFRKE